MPSMAQRTERQVEERRTGGNRGKKNINSPNPKMKRLKQPRLTVGTYNTVRKVFF